jgi:exosortase C (VPDSG-CTERM-specific)
MNKPNEVSAQELSPKPGGRPLWCFSRLGGFILTTFALVLCFSRPLYDLVRFAISSELYSHIVLIPFISAYLVWVKRQTLPPPSTPARSWAVFFLAAGLAVIAGFWIAVLSGSKLARVDSLALTTFSFLLLFGGVCGLFLGKQTLRAIAFPLGFLVFMAPFPLLVLTWMETVLQHASAVAAYAFFKISGMPVFNDGLVFMLPGFNMEVAPECSGIHSSLALFITSLLAGYFFLRTPWKRAALTLAVIPLAVLRNGLRIFTIGQLCVRISPEMIHSPIHRRGGPMFFVLSLVPFFLLLIILMKSERLGRKAAVPSSGHEEAP